MLLDEGKVDINRRSGRLGNSPIYSAAREGRLEVLRALLERGADATIANNRGFLPLYVAAEQNRANTLSFLLDVVDPRQSNFDPIGYSPLHSAARYNAMATWTPTTRSIAQASLIIH